MLDVELTPGRAAVSHCATSSFPRPGRRPTLRKCSGRPRRRRTLRVTGLVGNWTLPIDGKTIDDFSGDDWAIGIVGMDGPEVDQAERLRRQIVAKNELFFHRWRPQNEIYFFGFRKHEQGNNAVEIPRFDPMVASKDARIRELTEPAEHEYELIPEMTILAASWPLSAFAGNRCCWLAAALPLRRRPPRWPSAS